MTQPVLEIVRFRLAPGTTTETFVAAAQASVAPLSAQPGFVSRRLVQEDDGHWTDVVEWADLASAQRAAETVLADAALAPFLALIDGASVRMAHPAIRLSQDAA